MPLVAKRRFDASEVRRAAQGRWLEVLACLAGRQLDEAIARAGRHVTCPVHGTANRGRGDGFRLFKDVVETGGGVCNSCGSFHDGFELLQWLNGWDFRTALVHVAGALNVSPGNNHGTRDTAPIKPTAARQAEILARQQMLSARSANASTEAQARIDRLWKASIPLDRGLPEPLFRYWKRRGILPRRELIMKSECLRFQETLPYFDEDGEGALRQVGEYPALIAAIRDTTGNIVSLHRTYLTPAGDKAEVPCVRKMLPVPPGRSVNGAAIQLGGVPTDGALGVAEGMETAMAVMRVYGMPTWSLISASILAKFDPPAGVKTILVWADKDRSEAGQIAAEKLKAALDARGLAVHVLIPSRPIKGKSVDWNDVLQAEGVTGMPAFALIKRMVAKRGMG